MAGRLVLTQEGLSIGKSKGEPSTIETMNLFRFPYFAKTNVCPNCKNSDIVRFRDYILGNVEQYAPTTVYYCRHCDNWVGCFKLEGHREMQYQQSPGVVLPSWPVGINPVMAVKYIGGVTFLVMNRDCLMNLDPFSYLGERAIGEPASGVLTFWRWRCSAAEWYDVFDTVTDTHVGTAERNTQAFIPARNWYGVALRGSYSQRFIPDENNLRAIQKNYPSIQDFHVRALAAVRDRFLQAVREPEVTYGLNLQDDTFQFLEWMSVNCPWKVRAFDHEKFNQNTKRVFGKLGISEPHLKKLGI